MPYTARRCRDTSGWFANASELAILPDVVRWSVTFTPQATAASEEPGRPDHASGYRPWAELLPRTFTVDSARLSHRSIRPRCPRSLRSLGTLRTP